MSLLLLPIVSFKHFTKWLMTVFGEENANDYSILALVTIKKKISILTSLPGDRTKEERTKEPRE